MNLNFDNLNGTSKMSEPYKPAKSGPYDIPGMSPFNNSCYTRNGLNSEEVFEPPMLPGKDVFGCPFCRMDLRELRRALQHARRAPFELSCAIRRIPIRLLCENAGVPEEAYDELIAKELAKVYEGDTVKGGDSVFPDRSSTSGFLERYKLANGIPADPPQKKESTPLDADLTRRAEEFALGTEVQRAREDLYRRSGARMPYARDFRGYWT